MQGLSHGSVVIISSVNQQDEVSGHADSVVGVHRGSFLLDLG